MEGIRCEVLIYQGPLRAVVRAVPVAVLRPMIGASEAVSKTLLGARNSLDPRSKAELGDKYKRGMGGSR
jgi:autophagy-related protein 2